MSELMEASKVVFQNDRLDMPVKKDMTARVPARKRFTMTTLYPYFLNHASTLWIFSSLKKFEFIRFHHFHAKPRPDFIHRHKSCSAANGRQDEHNPEINTSCSA